MFISQKNLAPCLKVVYDDDKKENLKKKFEKKGILKQPGNLGGGSFSATGTWCFWKLDLHFSL